MNEHVRHPLDAYDTPPELALAIVQSIDGSLGLRRVVEPTAGTGAFVAAARSVWSESKISAVDLNPECEAPCRAAGANTFRAADILSISPAAFETVDLVIGNPPFKAADAIVRHIYPGLHDGARIVFLLAITFWAGKDRWSDGGLYSLAPLTDVIPVVPRPYFGLKNDPKFECAVFVWKKGSGSGQEPLRWTKPPKAERAKLRTFSGG